MCNKFVGPNLVLQLFCMALLAGLQSLELCQHLCHLVPHMCLSLQLQLPSVMHACGLERAACEMMTFLALSLSLSLSLSLMHQICGFWSTLGCSGALLIGSISFGVLTKTANIREPSHGQKPAYALASKALCVNANQD